MFSYAVMSVRCLLVLVLAVSAAGKLGRRSQLEELGQTLHRGLRLPGGRVLAGAWAGLEGLTAVGLAAPLTVGHAASLAVLEFGCLTVGCAVLVAQHRDFACNCFGVGHAELSWRTVLRNGGFTVAAVLLAAGVRSPLGSATPAPVVLAAVLTVLVAAVLALQAQPLRSLLGQWWAGRARGAANAHRTSALLGGRR